MASVMANILFIHPLMWFGIVALGIPVAIHLLTRRTPQDMVFPTLQFLRAAMARQSHLFRLRHILLLVLRTLLVLLLLLTFLKPVVTSNARHTARTEKAQASQVICLDTSLSMGAALGGVTPLAQAKAMAAQILERHRPGHRINLIRMASTAKRSFEEPGESLFFLRKDLQETTLSQERANVNAALAEAVRQLAQMPEGRKQIFLISDFQRSNWSAVDFRSVPEEIEIVFMPAGLANVANCAVTDVKIQPTSPTVGEPVDVICKVSNYSDQPCQVPLECRFKAGEHFTEQLTLGAQSSVSVSFKMQFKTPGQYEGTLVLPSDNLALDNRRFVTLEVADKVNVLLVSDAQGAADEVATHLLSRAINPYLEAHQATVVASVMPSNQINAVDLAGAQVVILSEIHELTPQAARDIVTYLRAGGSVI
ncbi:MAG: VWA domain-containing protein, partial [Planctomycetes bacterium]|nr:VWA domain-containing protein [Planctomycetota bacterium]